MTVRLEAPIFSRPRRLVGPISGTGYSIDERGYVNVADSDVVALLSDGFQRALLDPDSKLLSPLNPGTLPAYVTAQEFGDFYRRHTILTIATTLLPIAGGANLAVGKLIYTFPAGEIIVDAAYMSLGITQTQGNINADTPDGGLGTVIATGAVATLDGTATFEDILTGQTFNNCTGTLEVKTAIPTAGVPLVIAAAAAHTVHFNVADGWAASGDAAALLAGIVVLDWRFIK